MMDHVSEDTTREAGGFLVGRIGIMNEKLVTWVQKAVPVRQAKATYVEVRIGAEDWVPTIELIDGIREQEEEGKALVVGLYHSHPFGSKASIFLSPQDIFTMRHQFPREFSVSVVIDPISRSRDVFGWDHDKVVRIDPGNSFVIDDDLDLEVES